MPFLEGITNNKLPITNDKYYRNIWYWVFGIGYWKFHAKRGGFTLVELLVVLGILSATVGSSLLFLTSTLKGSNQATVISEVKQNGQVTLDVLERQVRGASDAALVNSHLKLTRSAGNLLHIKCFAGNLTPGSEKNGWIGTATSNLDDPPEVLYTSLTNKDDLVTGTDVSSCSLNVSEASTGGFNPAVVSIDFILNQGVKAPSRADFKANANFSTTISLRKANN